jgi:hypothetical protein
MRSEFIDETGRTYGRWFVVAFAGLNAHRSAEFHVRCICGEVGIVCGYMLRQGRSQSCGCLQRELAAKRLKAVNNYRESARPRVIRMWASGIRPRTWHKQHGKVQFGQDNPQYKHGRRCQGIDQKAYRVWLRQQKAVEAAVEAA